MTVRVAYDAGFGEACIRGFLHGFAAFGASPHVVAARVARLKTGSIQGSQAHARSDHAELARLAHGRAKQSLGQLQAQQSFGGLFEGREVRYGVSSTARQNSGVSWSVW